MSVIKLAPVEKIQVGNTSAWHLAFYDELSADNATFPSDNSAVELDSVDYYADIRATLPAGLEGGHYTITIENITDDDYNDIRDLPYARLFLYWLDTNLSAASYLKNLAGLTDTSSRTSAEDLEDYLVAVLKITSMQRRLGDRGYVLVIEAEEWIYERLSTRRLGSLPPDDEGKLDDFAAAANSMLQQRGASLRAETDYTLYDPTPNPDCPPEPPDNSADQSSLLIQGKTISELATTLAARLEERTGRWGRGMLLIRDGCLHIGPRPIPLDEDGPKQLSFSNGLIESERLADVLTDPSFDYAANPAGSPLQRRQFKLTLKGRPDLKPGDLVEFVPSPEDVASTSSGLFGSIGALASGPLLPSIGGEDFSQASTLYVSAVEHRLGRTTSFVTVITGVEITDTDNPWDCHSPDHRPADSEKPAHANAASGAASAVKQVAKKATEARSLAEVAEVRRVSTSGQNEPPSQTLGIWRGLRPQPANNPARRLDIQRPSPAPAAGVPYLSPFAWGKCGLVLPRYPGTRILVVHRDGRQDDPVDVGALWASGHGPDSQPGDWWLILPVGAPTDDLRANNYDPAPEHTGKVTQDLIDKDGNRVIEVGELTIRIGRGKLKDAGSRPDRGAADAVTIEHLDGQAKIVIDKNGAITIQGKNIELDAGSGNITMKAKKVDVAVQDAMDVHG